MADGSISFDATLSTQQLETELKRVRQKIMRLQEDLYSQQGRQLPLRNELKSLSQELSDAREKLKEMQAAPEGTYSEKQIADQQSVIAQIKEKWNSVNGELETVEQNIEKINGQIGEQKNVASQLGNEITSRAKKVKDSLSNVKEEVSGVATSTDGSANAIEKLGQRILGLAKRVFIFSVITKALRALRQWLSQVVMQNDAAKAAVARLQGALLTLAQPIVNVVIPAFTALVNVISRVVAAIASVVSKLFGTTAKSSANAAKALNQQASGYGGVGKAAKEASKSIMAFDELNTLNAEQDDDSSGGGGGSSSITPDFSLFNGLDIDTSKFEPLIQAIERFKKNITPLLETLKELGLWVYNNVLIPVGMWVANSFLPAFLDVLGKAIGIFNDALKKLQPVAQWIWEKILQPIAEWTGGIIVEWLQKIGDWIDRHSETLSSVVAIVLAITAAVLGVQAAIAILGTVLSAIGAVLSSPITWIALLVVAIVELWDNVEGFRVGMTEAWEGLKELLSGVIEFVKGFFTSNTEMMDEAKEKIKEGGKHLIEGLANGMQAAWEWAKEKIAEIWQKLVDKFREFFGIHSPSTLFAEFGSYLLEGMINGIKSGWEKLKSWFSSTIMPKFSTSYWLGKLQTIGEAFRSVFDGIGNSARQAANSVIGWINNMIAGAVSGLNSLGSLMGRIPGIGGMLGFHIEAPQIPMLAQGAVIPPNREFLAVLGDQTSGNNIEAPENLIRQIVREESGNGTNFEMQDRMDKMISIMEKILSKTGVYLDGEELANGLANHMRVINMERGW